MSASPRRRAFTLIELLVVIAIVSVLITLLLPSVQDARDKFNQQSADGAIKQIASQQSIFRNVDADADGLDDYGSLQELASFGTLNPDIADGQFEGYTISVAHLPPPNPSYVARAIPIVPKTGILRFYVDQTGVVRFSETGIPGPNSTPVVEGSECNLPEAPSQAACKVDVELAARAAIVLASGLVASDPVPGAAGLLDATPGLVPAIHAALDQDGDLQLDADEALSADWLAAARDVTVALDLAGGPAVGDDAALDAILLSLQDDLRAEFDLGVDAPQPRVPISDLPSDPLPAISFLLGPASLPALGTTGLLALAGALALAARRARTARSRG